MPPPPGQLVRAVKMLVQVHTFPGEIATVDTFATELRQQSDGVAFSRTEALRMAALEWLQARQARGTAAPALEAEAAPAAREPGAGVPFWGRFLSL